MNAESPRGVGARLGRGVAALLLALGMLLLSGCAGFSTRVTIVPSHQAFDVDLIMADNAAGDASEIGSDCDELGKAGADAKRSEHDNNTYCEIKIAVPLASEQPFVKHPKGRWVFQMTSKTLLAWLTQQFPSFGQRYPNGLKAEEFDDFHMRVDFPGRVVLHSAGSDVEGNSVIWNDAKLMFTEEGLHAESEDDASWLPIAITAAVVSGLAAIAGRVLWVLSRTGGQQRTRTWPPQRVAQWWQGNQARWIDQRRRDPRDQGGPR